MANDKHVDMIERYKYWWWSNYQYNTSSFIPISSVSSFLHISLFDDDGGDNNKRFIIL